MPSEVPEPPKGEHIFPATRMTELAKQWRALVHENRHDEARHVLQDIIIGSTAMFERLAQFEGFTYTVDHDTLVQAAREKVVRWLMAWDPKKPIFTFFSVCARHAFLSEVNKVGSHRKRFHATGDNLEKFFGAEDHVAHREPAAEAAKKKLRNLTIRWGDEVSASAIRYAIDCLVDERQPDRVVVIRSICYGFGLDEELGKFFYNWSLFATRDALYDRVHIPFTRQDLFRHRHTHTLLVDLLDIISWEQFQRLVATMGGQRLKVPTMQQLARLHDDWLLAKNIEEEGGGPAAVETAAKVAGRSPRAAGEIYEEIMHDMNPERSGEHDLYHESEQP